jgi:hypothetical protein
MKKHCERCEREFEKNYFDSKKTWLKKRFCSLLCANTANAFSSHLKLKGRKRPASVVLKMKATMFKKGHKTWNKGKSFDAIKGERHFAWKGDAVGYHALHSWVQRLLGKACRCDNPHCVYPRKAASGKTLVAPKKYEWTNKSHEYKRQVEDWIQLCVSCHQKYDLGKISLYV